MSRSGRPRACPAADPVAPAFGRGASGPSAAGGVVRASRSGGGVPADRAAMGTARRRASSVTTTRSTCAGCVASTGAMRSGVSTMRPSSVVSLKRRRPASASVLTGMRCSWPLTSRMSSPPPSPMRRSTSSYAPSAGRCSSMRCGPWSGCEVAAPAIWRKTMPSGRTPTALPSGAISEAAKGAFTVSTTVLPSTTTCGRTGVTVRCPCALAISPGATSTRASPARTSTSPSVVVTLVWPSVTTVSNSVPCALTTASGVRTT